MNKFMITLLAFSLLVFTGCQTEIEDLPPADSEASISAGSVAANYVARTASMDGSYDNIVDRASCISLNFPYVVEANGLEVRIDSRADLELIEEIFDASDVDDDVLELFFPITITTAAHEEVTVNNKEELRELAEACIEDGADDDIECVDFVYPVTVFTFDTDTQQTASFTLESDQQMYRFFKSLDANTRAGFRFPVKLKAFDGTLLEAENQEMLERIFEDYEDACDEDDDDDYNDDDFSEERLRELLAECPWKVNEFIRDGVNNTDQYLEYLMVFGEDGKVKMVDRLGNVLNGTFNVRVTDRGALLKLEFDVLVDFNLEWFVYEIGEGKIKLFTEEGNKILMQQQCDKEPNPDATLREILKECHWVIRRVKNQGEPIRRLLGYEFEFKGEGGVTLSNGINTSNGSWAIETTAEGTLVLAIEMGAEPAVSFEWPIADLRDDRLVFEVEEIGYELFLQRVCDDNKDDGDVVEIRQIMQEGNWQIAAFESTANVDYQAFLTYTFAFGEDHVMSMTLGQNGTTEAGLWRVLRNSDGELKVYLNGGTNEPLVQLTDCYFLESISPNRIELLVENEADGSFKMIVFERL